jgi:hypothetical protein
LAAAFNSRRQHSRHGEERSDEAIQSFLFFLDCFASPRNDATIRILLL